MAKPMAGVYLLTDGPFKGSQPHGSQGPWRHRLVGKTIIGLRQAPGLWELALEEGQVLALNWRRRQAGLRLQDHSILGGDWQSSLPLETPYPTEEFLAKRRQEQVDSWRAREQGRISKQMDELRRADPGDPEGLRAFGQRLSSLRHQVTQETEVFLLPSFDGEAPADRIDRRRGESLQDRVDRFYKEARREERRQKGRADRLEHLQARWVAIEGEEPPRRTVQPAAGPARGRAEKGVRRYCLPSGRDVFVGKDASSNHRVTFGLGRGRDLWFHRRNGPGPHVLLRRGKGETVPEEEVHLAAALALRFGPRGTEPQEEVRWTERRFLDPVPGQPGKVLVREERVLLVNLSHFQAAIENLLNR
tara:strand:- start:797 stop:1879 length:1083 start_codon:yes stop_codon:yes gene_type:complete